MRALRFVAAALLGLIPATMAASDPVRELEAKIRTGSLKLEFDKQRGYLDSLLRNLKVLVSSQTLVFSKTSLQSEHISPSSPRALYFNDDVYVAWVQGSPVIEIMSLDPETGAAFYMLGQEARERPVFERSTGHECSVCHYVREAAPKFVPRLLVTSVIPDENGDVEGVFPIPTSDRSPMKERWGGWYVTGTHGAQRHLGNIAMKTPVSPLSDLPAAVFQQSSNIVDLSKRFDVSRYLSPYSDIVALMVLGHQVEVQNLIAIATGKPAANPREVGEPLVKAMLFSGEVPLSAPVRGASTFAVDFPRLGPRDSRGRSLRDFDLDRRLFRYPLSYLIYSKPFDEMPPAIKTYVYRRLRDVLTGADKSPDFAHLSSADRAAILEILRETKRDFASIR